jgi:hypothetical protein
MRNSYDPPRCPDCGAYAHMPGTTHIGNFHEQGCRNRGAKVEWQNGRLIVPRRSPKITSPFKCYVCGQPVLERFAIATMSEDTDRAFLLHDKCSDQLEDETAIVRVKRS